VISSYLSHAQLYSGLVSPARVWFCADYFRKNKSKQIVIISKDQASFELLYSDLLSFVTSEQIHPIPAWDSLPLESVSPSIDISSQRLGSLLKLARGEAGIYPIPLSALIQRTLPRAKLLESYLQLIVSSQIDLNTLSNKLVSAGYQQVSMVETPGEFSSKGKTVDLFSANNSNPFRIELDQGRIVRISSFDTESQRTLELLQSAEIMQTRERTLWNCDKENLRAALHLIKERGRALEVPPREIARMMSAVRSAENISGVELLEAIINPNLEDVFSFLNPDAQIFIEDEISLESSLDNLWHRLEEIEAQMKKTHFLVPELTDLYLDPETLKHKLSCFQLHLLDHLILESEQNSKSFTKIKTRHNSFTAAKVKAKTPTQDAFQNVKNSIELIRRDGTEVLLSVGTENRAKRLKQILLSVDLDAKIEEGTLLDWKNSVRRSPLAICISPLSSGFEITEHKVAFISETEIFGDKSQRTAKKAKTTLKKIMSSLAQLNTSEYLVHSDFGIGKYLGLKHLDVAGSEADFLHIQYADSTLYLPIHNISKVSKFQAPEGQEPKLDKLKNSRFLERKTKVKHALETLAGDLLKLYAARSVAKGWRFDHFGSEDERFAEAFPYDETADQLKAIEDSINDMSMDKPMDRLICGDVGFGKTEVAIRAAFKCLQHNRQVAVLAPTTILAEQHRQSFGNRLEVESFSVDSVSRFKSPKQNKDTLSRLYEGTLDLVVGTHRLLSKDVQFKDLGLLIVDEEHRFGVKHKERLKELKKQVDVLTLTATPIPRTLHMSIAGLRDISVITTPPTDRRLIRTYLVRQDDNLIRDAIQRELDRGGQVFYLHNRIDSIAQVTAELAKLIPAARFEYGHGQMSEDKLEEIMRRFLTHETDVLVSTTIIESGIDIPNANTILIERADTFGLAQLYQLRGRVGRSKRQAFAYLMIPKQGNPGPDARARLKALQDLDDLGVGFNLAIRDLEIRGAGNLLGKEQSGHVSSIGFELYTKILKESIANLKGEEIDFRESVEPEIKLPVDAYIPEDYIPDVSERLLIYQRFSSIENDQEALQLLEELSDRYGRIPAEVETLSSLMRLRALLRSLAIVKFELKDKRLLIQYHQKAKINAEKVIKLHRNPKSGVKFNGKDSLALELELSGSSSDLIISACDQALSKLNALIAA
jgi:transcription-repair coupling factor (superfamily II helicase)